MKYLLLIAFLFLVFRIMQKGRAPTSRRGVSERAPENMVSCAHCGLNLPVSESLRANGRHYCCIAHRRADEARGR